MDPMTFELQELESAAALVLSRDAADAGTCLAEAQAAAWDAACLGEA